MSRSTTSTLTCPSDLICPEDQETEPLQNEPGEDVDGGGSSDYENDDLHPQPRGSGATESEVLEPEVLHFIQIKIDPDLHPHPPDEEEHDNDADPEDSCPEPGDEDDETVGIAPAAPIQLQCLQQHHDKTIPALIRLRDITTCSYQDDAFCSNCYNRITELTTGKKFSDVLCSRKGIYQNTTVLQALNLLFELEQKSWLSESILDPINYQICWNCTSNLTQLYKRFVDFTSVTTRPSYINSILEHNVNISSLTNRKPLQQPKISQRNQYRVLKIEGQDLPPFDDDIPEPETESKPGEPELPHYILPEPVGVEKQKVKKSKPSTRPRGRPSKKSSSQSPRKTKPKIPNLRIRLPSNYAEDSNDGDAVEEPRPPSPPIDDDEFNPTNYYKSSTKSTRKRKRKSSSSVHQTKRKRISVPTPVQIPVKSKKFKCPECSASFSKTYKLKRHLNVHTERRYICPTCDAGFKHSFILRKHQESSHNHQLEDSKSRPNIKLTLTRKLTQEERRRALICKDCGLVFSSLPKLTRHSDFQHKSYANTKWNCPEPGCTSSFKHELTMDRHRVAIHGAPESLLTSRRRAIPGQDYIRKPGDKKTRRYQCPKCPATFLRSNHIRRHIAVHKESNFICELCNSGFIKQTYLDLHNRRIHGIPAPEDPDKKSRPRLPEQKKFICTEPNCPSAFSRPQHYKRHLITIHGKTEPIDTNTKTIPCPVCNVSFQSLPKLFKHQITTHRPLVRENKFECEICGKKYRDRNNLRNHQASHRLDRPFLCDLCGFSTKRSYQLTRHHEMVHIGLRPHLCTTCGMSFKKKQHLRDHETKHYEISHRPYVCEHEGCNKSYRSKRNLRQHLESHLGCKFICETCGRIFTRKDNLKVHVDTLHLGKPGRAAKEKDKEKVTLDVKAEGDESQNQKPRVKKPRKSRVKVAPAPELLSQNEDDDQEHDEFEDENPPPGPSLGLSVPVGITHAQGIPIHHFQTHQLLQLQQQLPPRLHITSSAGPPGSGGGAAGGTQNTIITLPVPVTVSQAHQFGEFFYM